MSEPATPPRYFEIDLLKAVGILAVALIHCLRPPWDPNIPALELWLGEGLRFAVPSFLFASGFLYSTSATVPLATTLRRARRIVFPYLVASLGAQIYNYTIGQPPIMGSVLVDLLFGGSFGPYYYVLQIVVLVLMTPLFAVLTRSSSALLGALLVLAILFQFALDQGWVFVIDIGWYIRVPFVWWSYFLLGWWARLHYSSIQAFVTRHRAALMVGFAALACALLVGAGVLTSRGPVRAANLASTYALVGLLFVSACGRRSENPLLKHVSDSSYTIYLFHLFLLYPLTAFLRASGEHWLVALFVPWAAGIAGALLLVWLGRKLLGARSRDLIGA